MNEMRIFNSEQFGAIRTIEISGEPWFCLTDVCRPLGIQTRDCKKRLKEDGVDTIHSADSLGRPNTLTFINEGNLYRAIFQSKKAEAEAFTDWVTEEVLPTLRKTGAYSVTPSPELSPGGFAALLRVYRRSILDLGGNAQDVSLMMQETHRIWNVPIPETIPAITAKASSQLSLFDSPMMALEG